MLRTAVRHPPVPATRAHTHGTHTCTHACTGMFFTFPKYVGLIKRLIRTRAVIWGVQEEAWRRIKSIILILLKRTSNSRGGQGGTGHVTALSPNFSTKWCLLVGKKKREKIKGFFNYGF